MFINININTVERRERMGKKYSNVIEHFRAIDTRNGTTAKNRTDVGKEGAFVTMKNDRNSMSELTINLEKYYVNSRHIVAVTLKNGIFHLLGSRECTVE